MDSTKPKVANTEKTIHEETNVELDTLLIVEDDARFRETLAVEFRDRGYIVTEAANFAEFSEACERAVFRFALVDLRLGADHGLKVVERLHAASPRCRIVMMTGYGSIATAVEAVKKGASQYLTKPVSIDALETALEDGVPQSGPTPPGPGDTLARHEREYIEFVLAQAGQNISEAARRLGIHRQSLQRKLRKFTPI